MSSKSFASWLLILVGIVGGVHRAPAAAGSIHIGGKEYVRLHGWASARKLEVRWIKRDHTLQLGNGSSRMVLTVDSREAQVNGVMVWMLFPILSSKGNLYISQLDAQYTFQPVLTHPRNRGGANIRSVCLDPGHGGKDPGNRSGSHQEKKYTLLLAQEVRDQLTRAGIKVTMTRSTDNFIELPSRPELARRRKADLFVSLHFNSAASRGAKGAEVYCLTPAGASSTNARGEGSGAGSFAGNRFNEKNMALAYQVQKSLIRALNTEDRGVRRARFAVLRDAAMPAILIEAGFMSNADESKKIFDPSHRRAMAKAIVEGLLAYKRAVEQPT